MIPILTVSQFLNQVNEIILGYFTVEGEISEVTINQGKFLYIKIKDESSLLQCFAMLFKVKIPLEVGMKVRVSGYPKVRNKTGKFSFNIESIEIVGESSLQKAYILLKKKLESEGLFDISRKRKLPQFPGKIGVVASRESAAWGDFIRILNNRWSGVAVELCHVVVQGEAAVKEIVNAFKMFNELNEEDKPEVLVLIRGGGSLEDLQAFNSEEVARAVYSSTIPVICGVGHERDESLADFVADLRASTPSNAAELMVPDKKDMMENLENTLEYLEQKISFKVLYKKQEIIHQLNFIESKITVPLKNCSFMISNFNILLDKMSDQVQGRMDGVNSMETLLNSFNPKRVLKRGYSITRDEKGRVVKNSDQMDEGEKIMVELYEGKIEGKVISKN